MLFTTQMLMRKRIASGIGGIDEYTSVMLHFDGNEVDSSLAPVSITTTGTPAYEDGKFGQAAKFSGSTYFGGISTADFPVDRGEWTIDLWIKPLSTQSSNSYIIGRTWWNSGPGNIGFSLRYTNTRQVQFQYIDTDYVFKSVSSSTATLSLNTWHHIAVERDNSANRVNLFIDGMLCGYNAIASTTSLNSARSAFLTVGGGRSGETSYLYLKDDLLDEVRLSSIARYRGVDFTPPNAPYSQE